MRICTEMDYKMYDAGFISPVEVKKESGGKVNTKRGARARRILKAGIPSHYW
jgi:hypothetical protein